MNDLDAEAAGLGDLDAAEDINPDVTLRGVVYHLTPPASYAERLDVRAAAGANWRRGCAAALVSCLPEKARRKLGCSLESARFDVLRYGGDCLDALGRAKVPIDEILAAGFVAIQICRDVDSEKVEAVAKN